MKGSPAKNLPAVATCLERSWETGTILVSTKWASPRMIEALRGTAFVVLRAVRDASPESPEKPPRTHRPDGTFAEMHGMLGGRKHVRIERVRSFPPDVRRYYTDLINIFIQADAAHDAEGSRR